MSLELLLMIFLMVLFHLSQQNMITVDCNSGNDTLCSLNSTITACKTIHNALQVVRSGNTTIQIYSRRCLYNKTSIATLPFSNISIIGNGSDVTVVECDRSGTGFGLINASNVNISGLTLSRCGQLRNSTTINTSYDSVLLFRAAIYFLNVTNVTIHDVVVTDSIGMGIAMYDVVGHVHVSNSIFINNSVPLHELTLYPGGGGVSVEFSYCKPGGYYPLSCTNTVNTNEGASYLFYNCTFDGNTASTLNKAQTSYPSHTFGIGNQQFGRGGGLSVFFKGHSVCNLINISNCIFEHNHAVWGGGFHSDIVDFSNGNILTLENCNFSYNHCNYNEKLLSTGTGGGGARIAFLFYDPQSKVTNNSVQFINCRFQFNTAYFGGGLSCRVSKENNVTVASNSLELVNCTWEKNVARTGSGLDIISHVFPHGLSPVVKIANCNFTANSNNYSNMGAFPLGIGALYADNIPVNFSGNCIFTGNKDSAITGLATHFIFSNDTSAVFYNNSGWYGAGMALLGNAYFIVYHNTSLQFINNSAVTKGGAIYFVNSGQKDFISTQRCLFYYYDFTIQNHSNWVTTFNFSGNNASVGRSIYCTTLLACIWGNIPRSVSVSKDDILQVFNWSGIFYYDDKCNKSEEIATDALNISIGTIEHVKIPPGRFYPLYVTPLDDRGQRAYPLIFAQTNTSNISAYVTTFESDYFVKLYGKINSNISLYLHTFNNRPYISTIDVTVDKCPPGFYYPSSEYAVEKTKQCKCSTGTSEKLYGVTDCDNDKFVAHLNPQFWAGYLNLEGKEMLMTSDCFQDYCSDTRVQLPGNSSHTALDKLLCSHHRTGNICGKCQSGYFVYINSPTYQCGPCNDKISDHGYIIIIVSKYVPLTIMMCFIIFFGVSLVDGPLNSFILYSQILVALQVYGNGKIGLPTESSGLALVFITILIRSYDIWNLQFFEFLLPHFCVFKHNTSMVTILAEYSPAFYVLLLCLVFFFILPWICQVFVQSHVSIIRNCVLRIERIFIRVRYQWSIRNSVIHSLTTFLVLSYARITLTTFKILAFVILYGPGGQNSHYKKTVVWYDGTMSYFGHEHLPYAVTALFMLIIFVLLPPLFLLSYPLLPVLLAQLGLQDYWIVNKLIINPLSKCVPIFDAFQSCYKDKYRFFAGLLFVYRVAALAIYSFAPNTTENYVCIQLFFLLVLFIHCACQPYKSKWHNLIEAFIFTLLASISVISSYCLFQAETFQAQTNVYFWIQAVLLCCPLVYFIVYVTCKIAKWLHPQIKHLWNKMSCNTWRSNDSINEYAFPARMEDDGDDYSTTSESTDDSLIPDDEQQQQEHEQDNDVEMIYPVDWNDISTQKVSSRGSHSGMLGRNWVTQ